MTRVSNKVLVLIIIISLMCIIVSTLNKKDNIIPVFKEYDSNKTYIIDVEGLGITTNNISMLDTNEIIAIYPNISKKYQSIMDNGWYNIDKTISFNSNIDNINRYYKNIFNRNKLNIKVINIDIDGVSISKIKVITDNIDKYSKYNYEKVNY